MKRAFLFLTALFGSVQILFAQTAGSSLIDSLPEIQISALSDIHFLSPEPIQYADISTRSVIGDLPVKTLLRIKLLPDSLSRFHTDCQPLGIITITGESFIAQYRLVYTNAGSAQVPASVVIQPEQCRPLDFPGITLTTPEMRKYAISILAKGSKSALRKASAYGLCASLNHVYTVGDHIFLDISYSNDTNLPYDIDELRFKIEDKKITKATNVQSLEIKPVWQLYPQTSFKKGYHNVFVFKKVTFPDNKVLNVELTEKQVSGRTLTLQIKYKDLLAADNL